MRHTLGQSTRHVSGLFEAAGPPTGKSDDRDPKTISENGPKSSICFRNIFSRSNPLSPLRRVTGVARVSSRPRVVATLLHLQEVRWRPSKGSTQDILKSLPQQTDSTHFTFPHDANRETPALQLREDAAVATTIA